MAMWIVYDMFWLCLKYLYNIIVPVVAIIIGRIDLEYGWKVGISYPSTIKLFTVWIFACENIIRLLDTLMLDIENVCWHGKCYQS